MADFVQQQTSPFTVMVQIGKQRALSCYPLLLSHWETLRGVKNINLVCVYDLCCSQLSVRMPCLPPPPPDLVCARSEGFKYCCHTGYQRMVFLNQPVTLEIAIRRSWVKKARSQKIWILHTKGEMSHTGDWILLSVGFVVFLRDSLHFCPVIEWDY